MVAVNRTDSNIIKVEVGEGTGEFVQKNWGGKEIVDGGFFLEE